MRSVSKKRMYQDIEVRIAVKKGKHVADLFALLRPGVHLRRLSRDEVNKALAALVTAVDPKLGEIFKYSIGVTARNMRRGKLDEVVRSSEIPTENKTV